MLEIIKNYRWIQFFHQGFFDLNDLEIPGEYIPYWYWYVEDIQVYGNVVSNVKAHKLNTFNPPKEYIPLKTSDEYQTEIKYLEKALNQAKVNYNAAAKLYFPCCKASKTFIYPRVTSSIVTTWKCKLRYDHKGSHKSLYETWSD